ncbi:MAG TPA: translation initiation factor IF-2 subunit beta [Candidatus Thermoplasmatota archaeon]|nr:translation initiation factor IF-2 subunit beta [Candidatus Thermoplasmatota archaeon]
MPAEDPYRALLSKARAKLPSSLVAEKSRFQVPEADVAQEGRTTQVRNLDRILSAIRREPDHMVKTILGELGRAGSYENGRLTLQGLVPTKQVKDAIQSYITTYVICDECGAPDTHFEKDHRIMILRCEACGGHRPIKARPKSAAAVRPAGPKEGEEVEVDVTGQGKQGDGVAHMGNYILFIKGAARGERCKVKITRVMGTTIFAEKVVAPQT